MDPNPFEQPPTTAPTPQTVPALIDALHRSIDALIEAPSPTEAAKATHSSMRMHDSADTALILDVGPTNLPQNLDPSIRAGLTCPLPDPFKTPQPDMTAPWNRNKAPMGTRPKACMYDRSYRAQPKEPEVTEAAETTMWSSTWSPVSDDDATLGTPRSAMSTGSKDEKPEDDKPEDEKPMSKRAQERQEGRNRPKSNKARTTWYSRFYYYKSQGWSSSKIVEELGEAPPRAKASQAGKGK
jgi:hypothetical protein